MYINPNYAVKSRKYRYNYFFNTQTKVSNWEIPRIAINRLMIVNLYFSNFDWEQIESNWDVIMQWLITHLGSIRLHNNVDLPLDIEWVDGVLFRVRTNLYSDLSESALEEFYWELKEPDNDGNNPIYCVRTTNMLTLEQPEGEAGVDWEAGLVKLTYL